MVLYIVLAFADEPRQPHSLPSLETAGPIPRNVPALLGVSVIGLRPAARALRLRTRRLPCVVYRLALRLLR
jgi:hypothetical protein